MVDFITTGADANGHVESGAIQAIVTSRGREISASSVVLTTGTFMEGKIFIGEYEASAGRLGEQAALGLGVALRRIGFNVGRLKTGTPPRILRTSVDFSTLERQDGDIDVRPFSYAYDTGEPPDGFVLAHLYE